MTKKKIVKLSAEEFKRLLDQVKKIPSAKATPVCMNEGCDGTLQPVSFNCTRVITHECDNEQCKRLYCCEETLQKTFEEIVLVSIGQKKQKLSLAS